MRFAFAVSFVASLASAVVTRNIEVGKREGICPAACPTTSAENTAVKLTECLTGITDGSYPNCTYTARVTINGEEDITSVCTGTATNGSLPIHIYTLPALVDINNASLGVMTNSEVVVGFKKAATAACEYKLYNSTATSVPTDKICEADQATAAGTGEAVLTIASGASTAKFDVSTLVDNNKMTLAYKYLIGNAKSCPELATVTYANTTYEFAVTYMEASGAPQVLSAAGLLLVAQHLLL